MSTMKKRAHCWSRSSRHEVAASEHVAGSLGSSWPSGGTVMVMCTTVRDLAPRIDGAIVLGEQWHVESS